MFRKLLGAPCSVNIVIDGRDFDASPGDSVATALLLNDVVAFRTSPVNGELRGPYCGMGVCFDCLVTINGEGNCQACMTIVKEGLVIETGATRRDLIEETGQ